jgi:Protein of unknown function (DUF3223)
MAKPVTIGIYSFKTKAAAKDFIRDTRDRYPQDGVRIQGSDEVFLHSLLALHPEASDKIGSGISHFTVETDPEFRRTRHFTIHRTDGSSTDFSFNACLDGKNERADRLESLRRAVEDQILAFRDSVFSSSSPVVCPIDGSILLPNGCHVDHEFPKTFLVLVEGWLTSSSLRIDQIEITPPQDNQVVTYMTCHDQRKSWSNYHQRNAALRVVSPRSNLSARKN